MSGLLEKIRNSIIGENWPIHTPFGEKPLVYADYTASGRSLSFLEDIIRQKVMPFYANTHTESSFTGARMTSLREEARQIIRAAVNASEKDSVIFCGSGATSANQKLVHILNLQQPGDVNKKYRLDSAIPAAERPVVFVGSYEHHSNELSWRESLAEVVVIPLNDQGLLDIDVLEQKLQAYQNRPLKVGSFSAASNVTGLLTDVKTISALLHRYGALSFWDYAAAAPYVEVDMTGQITSDTDTSLDAVFISPHKFIGGPGTPGVLILKNHVATNSIPSTPGGGTVSFVTPERHRYIANVERREEGGTPSIIECIRAGLVFKLKHDVGVSNIKQLESSFIKRAIERLNDHPNIEILGNVEAPRLSIMSFVVKHQGQNLHYGFIAALLNDLFGIQARGGCSCAGPYAHHLLGLDDSYSSALETRMSSGESVMRPGWVRLNFNYFLDEATFDYLLQALEMVAEHGWRLYPYYRYDNQRGLWRYQGASPATENTLSELDFVSMQIRADDTSIKSDALPDYLAAARKELLKVDRDEARFDLELSSEAQSLKWFMTPQEIQF